jgi:NADH-ubiquinone oxidoreductase chain 3
MLIIFCSLLLVGLVGAAGSALSIKGLRDLETSSPYECGFTPILSARIPFSIRFFIVTLIFLIFDVELVLIFPFIVRINSSWLVCNRSILILFLFILIFGVIHE